MVAPPSVLRRRRLLLPISVPTASREHLATYLAQVDRPLISLLAQQRLSHEAPGRVTYRSNPHRLLHWEVVPTLSLAAQWNANRLQVRSTECRLAGLGDWAGDVGFTLTAVMEPAEGAVAGWVEVGLHSRLVRFQGARALARLALEHVLDRIERRLGRGFHKDVLAWLATGGDRSGSGG